MTAHTKKIGISDILCVLTILIIHFSGITNHDLWSPDEHRVSAISLEMSRTGNLVVPHLAGTPFVEKPPLFFAFSALMIKTLGPVFGNTSAVRLGSAFFGLGVLLMTFFIGRHIGGWRTGFMSAIFLASMEGFVENYHWIRVDTALSFFVAGAVFCLIKVYHENRYSYAAWAGICIAGAFLSKGLIGPMFIAIPWFLLFVQRIHDHGNQSIRPFSFAMQHMLIIGFMIFFSALWIIPFYHQGGDALWHEWFWVNHVQRFTGAAAEKGHIVSGKPFYYIKYLLVYGLPWAPLVFYWCYSVIVQFIKERHIDKKNLFLFSWGLLSLLMLSFSATKRPIYLTPVLPAYAIMAGLSLSKGMPKWFKYYGMFWIGLCLVLISFVTFCPLMTGILPPKVPPRIVEGLSHFGGDHILSFMGLIACIFLTVRYRNRLTHESILVFTTGILYISLLGAPMKALDCEKSLGNDIRVFTSRIPESDKNHMAGVDISETFRGCLYYYSGLNVPPVSDPERVISILQGKDELYNQLIFSRKIRTGQEDNALADEPYRIVNKEMIGPEHALYIIQGRGD